MMTRVFLVAFALCVVPSGYAAEPPAAKVFAKTAQYLSAKISPTGKYLALTAPVGDQTALAFIDLEKMKLTSGLTLTSGDHVDDYWWINPERAVVSIARSFGPLDQLRLTGELYAVNADGSQRAYLYGYRGGQQTGTRRQIVRREYGVAQLIDTLADQNENILVSIGRWAGDLGFVSDIELLNAYTGNRVRLANIPGYPEFDVVADRQGSPRFAYSADKQGDTRLYTNSAEEVDWQPVPAGAIKSVSHLHQLDRAATGAYLTTDLADGRNCLQRYVFASASFEEVSCVADGHVGRPTFATDTGRPIALMREQGRPERAMLDGAHPDGKLLQVLDQSFPGRRVTVTSATDDGKKLILLVTSDRDAGAFYLFDRVAMKARYLVSRRQWIDPGAMQPSEAVRYEARDGVTIHGYLTVANGLKARGLPLVVMPHGGPHGVRDFWEWHPWAQFLASRGYAVLQPNYRGSGGYGWAFERAGYLKWGTAMQDDLTDGVKWAIAQGIADPARVCIFGASYGGYAALMSATREPDLYRCAATLAGVYDLGSQREDSDTADSMIGRKYLREVLGEDETQWAEQSPVTHVARLKAPVLIAHGTSDERVPFSQAKTLRKALDKHGKPYEWIEYAREEHGFYKEENHEDFLNRLAAFLDRHIGTKVESPAAKP